MSDHLTPEEFFEFIDQGGGSGPAGWRTSWTARSACTSWTSCCYARHRPRPRRKRSSMTFTSNSNDTARPAT